MSFEQIFRFYLQNGVGSNSGTGSRFSQWFKRESPIQQADSRRTSIQDELLNNLLNDITEPNIQIPSVTESNTYFAPISPANTTNNTNSATNGVKLLEMLHRGNKPSQNGQGDASNTAIPMKNCSIKDLGKSHICISPCHINKSHETNIYIYIFLFRNWWKSCAQFGRIGSTHAGWCSSTCDFD